MHPIFEAACLRAGERGRSFTNVRELVAKEVLIYRVEATVR